MSQDGSSSKSYIKHPTEKARLDNLAFTSFPEDYLPYTSPSYQRKAPYLVWDHHHYDGGGPFRAKHRRLRRFFCGTAALASAIVLLVAAIIGIVAVSVYLGVVTNLFRSPIFSLSGKFRVMEGDTFEESLLNQTSYEFLTKAEYYKVLIQNVYSSSSLAPAFVAARVLAFRPGSVLVFFRIHLDRRKLVDGEPETMLVAKQVLLQQAIASPSQSFDNLVLDLPSIEIREYVEDWMMDLETHYEAEGVVGLHATPENNESSNNSILRSTYESPVLNTTMSSIPTQVSTTANILRVTSKHGSPILYDRRPAITGVRVTPPPPPRSTVTNNRQGAGYGYAEWKPIDLPEAIQVSSMGSITPAPKRPRPPLRTGSVTSVEDHKPQPSVVTRNGANSGNVRLTAQPNVASSITSSVSLFIRPSSKNKTKAMASGVVAIDKSQDSLLSEPMVVGGTLTDNNRKNSGSFRYLEFPEEEDDNTTHNEAFDTIIHEEIGTGDVFEEMLDDFELSGLTELESLSAEKPDSDHLVAVTTTVPDVAEPRDHAELSSGGLDMFESENHTASILEPHLEDAGVSVADIQTQTFSTEKDEESTSATSPPEYFTNANTPTLTLTDSESPSNDSNEQETTPFETLINTVQFTDKEPTTFGELSGAFQENSSISEQQSPSLSFTLVPSDIVANHSDSSNSEETILTVSQYPTQETTYQTLENGKLNHSIGAEKSTSAPVTMADITVTLSADSMLNSSTTLLQDLLRFRKIVQSHKEGSSNPNDIYSKDSFPREEIFIRIGNASAVRTPIPLGPTIDGKVPIDENEIGHETTPLPTTLKGTDVSSEVFEPVLRCLESEMTCGSGECVPLDYLCNMRRDCTDNSDEEHCTCADYLRVLGQPQKLCDGIQDCWDHSDEENCPWCSPGQFPCLPSKVCINSSQVCDGSNDCPFGTDERHCVKLAEDEERAISLDYYSEGYLMVRKSGSWGKLCLSNDLVTVNSLQHRLDEIGRAVCSTLTYRDFQEAVRVNDEESDQNTYYEISGQPNQPAKERSSAIFEPTSCPNKGVVRVKCQSLECGMRPMGASSRRRIVGGQSTGSGAWPWQVALYKEGDFQCGAVLVSDSWLISAGHCFYSTQNSHWTARMGILRRGTELRSPSEQVRHISQIILHPEYVDKGFINDIALLRLEKPVPFSDYLRPLCLPTKSEDAKIWDGQYCSVVGWGKLFEIGHTFPDSLQEVRLPVISTEECRKRIIFLSMYHITDNMFCAGYEQGGQDACLGDSGGPLMCQRQDGRWVLLGVTSNGDGCGRPGRPGVYTKVTQYLDWINQIMSETTWIYNQTTTCLGHRCELGRCVQQYKVCDKRFDCPDGSDEKQCPLSSKT